MNVLEKVERDTRGQTLKDRDKIGIQIIAHKNSGVTLIALMVTIIVLLILSGIGAVMLTGKNSVINKAIQASEVTNKAEAKERVQLEVLGSFDEDGELSKEKLKRNLKSNLGIQDNQILDTNETDEFKDPVNFPLNGYDVEVKPNGEVEVTLKEDDGI